MIPQNQIFQISEGLSQDPAKILDKFQIQYEELPNRLTFACPVHNGDNPTGACIFTDGDTAKGNWACWTRGCHEDYGNNILGFLQGLLSCRNDDEVGFPQTINCAKGIVGDVDFKIDSEIYRKSKEEKLIEVFNRDIEDLEIPDITREMVIERLNIPSPYYLGMLTNENIAKRRCYFSPEVLKYYDIGDCMESGKPMAYRAVVPVYDENERYLGCTGRKIYENNDYGKWKNSAGKGIFSRIFYGFHKSLPLIKSSATIIIVEGQGDVWRATQSGAANNGSLMGSVLSEDQLIILEKIGVQNIILLTDFDDAGEKAAEEIRHKGGRRFCYWRPTLPKSLMKDIAKFYSEDKPKADVADLKGEEFKEHVIDKKPKGFEVIEWNRKLSV